MNTRLVVTLAVLSTVGVNGLGAQVITGVVVDGRDGSPLLDASVVLLDSQGAIKRGWLTDADGAYRLVAPEPGRYTVRAGGAGLETWDSPPIVIGENQEFALQIRLVPAGTYEGLKVFEQRRSSVPGTFLIEEQIREKGGDRFTDVFRHVPGVSIVPLDRSEYGARESLGAAAIVAPVYGLSTRQEQAHESEFDQSYTLRISGSHSGADAAGVRMQLEGQSSCPPVLHVNGRWWGPLDNIGLSGPDYELQPSTIQAIEIYTRNEVPPALDTGRDDECGVIVIWTTDRDRS